MSALLYYLVLLAAFTLTVVLAGLLLFGRIEKQQPRNSLGLRVGKPRFYFLFGNDKFQVRYFMVVYILTLVVTAYFLFKIYE